MHARAGQRAASANALPWLYGTWRHWLLAVTLIAFLGAFSLALTHYHKNEAQELDCPVCHVVGHQSLDAGTLHLAVHAAFIVCLIISLSLATLGRRDPFTAPCPATRAPPALSL